ncbi:carbohydrate ABC transporter permease [Clostridium sp. WB02_MRS01]|uniref:carbohydrate ABC transporter permease n=1 Tax=Clostridium sp. WB02_MRS01 TaxID=2605777 RepID=UPI0012B1EFCA|nr:carbohydrate ABC transporter permease [Clostridium sp. WB02_MRS01]MSS08226.1 carbohydrate ABC transporter permease [Clostridium sp. WB02_MRS01]
MKKNKKFKWFPVLNTIILIMLALICVIPLVHVAAVSFSSSAAASAGDVSLWPKDFTTSSYSFVAKRPAFWRSMKVSVTRIIMGGGLSILLTITAAYPLSQPKASFRFRTVYAWFFFITMIFNAGLIPWYMVIRQFGLLDSIWALILPGAVPVFSVILLLNFFREVPRELAEAAFIDGAGHWRTLWTIYVPLSKPALATLLLFSLVANWNSWFDGLILMNNPDKYPLQTYIQTIAVQRSFSMMTREEIQQMATISDRTLRSAQIFLGSLPIVMVYPFLQKYFVKGIVLGGVKG